MEKVVREVKTEAKPNIVDSLRRGKLRKYSEAFTDRVEAERYELSLTRAKLLEE